MKIEKRFNRRSAGLIDVHGSMITSGANDVKVTFYGEGEAKPSDKLAMHLTRDEALQLGRRLLLAVEKE